MASASIYQAAGGGNQAIELDPSAPGTIIRWAIILEGILNIPFAVACLLYPRTFLSKFFVNSSDATPAAASLIQLIGVSTFMISFWFCAAIPNTRSGLENRKPAYYAIASAEVMMISLWVWQGWVLGEERSGVSKQSLKMAMVNMVPLVTFRLFALFVMPQWFGRYRIKGKAS